MALEVVHAHHRQVAGQRQPLCELDADEEAPDQAGPFGDRHRRDVGQGDAGLIERLLHHPGDGQCMAARGQLGHHAAIEGMQGDL